MTTPEELDALQEARRLLAEAEMAKATLHPGSVADRLADTTIFFANEVIRLRARVAELEARATAAEAELARRGQVQVNLVWEDLDGYAWRATAPLFGSFRVERYGNGPWQALWSVPGYCATFVDGGFATAEDAKQAIEARTRAALVSPGDGWRRCDGCRAVGAIHCAHPDECGNMKHVSVADLIAQADSWQSWLDDLPLPDDFREGANDCQQYIADLSYALQPLPALPASEGA